jgi:hypothetical protein
MTLDNRESRQIAILVNEQIEDEITDARRLTARMLEQVEIWSPEAPPRQVDNLSAWLAKPRQEKQDLFSRVL